MIVGHSQIFSIFRLQIMEGVCTVAPTVWHAMKSCQELREKQSCMQNTIVCAMVLQNLMTLLVLCKLLLLVCHALLASWGPPAENILLWHIWRSIEARNLFRVGPNGCIPIAGTCARQWLAVFSVVTWDMATLSCAEWFAPLFFPHSCCGGVPHLGNEANGYCMALTSR